MMPETCNVGFKEWAGVCDALATGKQSIILRKGGIDEVAGPGLFVPEHSAFWLYPTYLHGSVQGLRDNIAAELNPEPGPPGKVRLSSFAVAQSVGRIEDEQILESLREFHVWTDETVHKRFHYRSPGLWVLALRTYTRDTPYVLDVTPEQAGCKSWVLLDQPLSTSGMKPAATDDAWILLKQGLQSLLKRA